MRRPLLVVSLLTVIVFVLMGYQQKEEPSANDSNGRPNIIFILTDDLGYGDLGINYQNKRAKEVRPAHKTPKLDQVAAEGVRFNRHYAPPICAPSRASLLQGVHQGHAQVRNNQFDKALSDNHNIATVLKAAGYATGLIGKYWLQAGGGTSLEDLHGATVLDADRGYGTGNIVSTNIRLEEGYHPAI
ncbi:MAG TPA: sulfatase-like hydrolase/transferase [Fodinibius sp.]|nr:sulfatase-like hydrolase/transferase [Fodinibius sp.]